MSSDNEFPIPFEESRRGLAANQEEKAAIGRLGQYLASRGVNRPTIGEGRKKRRIGNIELPTGGKPGKRKPTGSRRDVDGDGWADEGTEKPVFVGMGGQGKKPKQETENSKLSSSSSERRLSSGFYNLIAIETDESTPEKLESLKEQLGDALVSHETSTVDIGARGESNVRKKHTFRIDNSGLRNTYAHNYATNRGFLAQLEVAPSETRLSSGMTQLSEIEVYNYGKLKAAKKVRSTQPKGKEKDYWIVLDKDGEVRAYSSSAVDEKRKKLLDNFNQQGENPLNGKKSPLSIDDIDMQDVLRDALDDKKMKIIAALETYYVEDRNEVFQINTRDGHRRRGIAAEMFNTHREVFPERDLQHSDILSEDGKAFSAATPAISIPAKFASGKVQKAKLNVSRYGKNDELISVDSFEINGKTFYVQKGGDTVPGGYNGYLVAFDDIEGQKYMKNVGYLDFQKADGSNEVLISMISVEEDYRRQGIAEALLDSFIAENPDSEISPGGTTEDGGDWWRAVTGSDGPIKAERNTRLSSGAKITNAEISAAYTRSIFGKLKALKERLGYGTDLEEKVSKEKLDETIKSAVDQAQRDIDYYFGRDIVLPQRAIDFIHTIATKDKFFGSDVTGVAEGLWQVQANLTDKRVWPKGQPLPPSLALEISRQIHIARGNTEMVAKIDEFKDYLKTVTPEQLSEDIRAASLAYGESIEKRVLVRTKSKNIKLFIKGNRTILTQHDQAERDAAGIESTNQIGDSITTGARRKVEGNILGLPFEEGVPDSPEVRELRPTSGYVTTSKIAAARKENFEKIYGDDVELMYDGPAGEALEAAQNGTWKYGEAHFVLRPEVAERTRVFDADTVDLSMKDNAPLQLSSLGEDGIFLGGARSPIPMLYDYKTGDTYPTPSGAFERSSDNHAGQGMSANYKEALVIGRFKPEEVQAIIATPADFRKESGEVNEGRNADNDRNLSLLIDMAQRREELMREHGIEVIPKIGYGVFRTDDVEMFNPAMTDVWFDKNFGDRGLVKEEIIPDKSTTPYEAYLRVLIALEELPDIFEYRGPSGKSDEEKDAWRRNALKEELTRVESLKSAGRSDGPIKAERNTRLSSGAAKRLGLFGAIYDQSVDHNDKRNPSGLLETSRDGKEYSSIRFNGDGYDIKTSESEDGFSVFIEDESGQIASLTFSEPPTGEATELLSYKASKESQKAGVLEALLDHVLVKNPDTNITSSAETRRWFNYVNNGTADYGAKGFRKYGFFAKYSDGEDVLRGGDYTLESDLLLKTSNVSSSPVVVEGFTPKEYIWTGQVFKIGNESIVFGAHEQAEFGDEIKKLPLNPFEILKLDPSSAEGRKAAQKWYSAVHGANVSVLAESSDFNASSYVSALLYAASKGNKDAQKEFDEFAKYSDALLEKLDSKLLPVENPEKALSLDARMIHQTSYKPTIDEKGYLVLRPLEDFPQTAKDGTEVTVNRTTLHFAVNHLAEGHLFRKETEGESYVVIAPLDSFIKENPDSLENFNIVDTAASPPPGDGLRFPPGSYKLIEVKEGEDGRKKVEDILRADGVEVLAGGERNSGTPGADEAGRIRAQMLGVSSNVASDLTLANLEQINRTNINDQKQYIDVPSSTYVFQEASKNALLRIANRKENTWVSASRKLNDKDPLSVSATRLASGRAPRYPREPTLGAFLEGAQERFDGVSSWEEFKERYAETEIVFLDYETTGLDFDEFGKATTNGNPTQIGLVRMKNGKEIGRLNLFMNPEQPLGEWSLANLKDVDGNPITNEWLATQMPMAEAHRQIAEFIGPDAIIGVQNATFDKRVLEDALEREGIDWRPSGYLDTRDISAMTLPVWSEESPEGPYITDRDGNKKPSSSLAAITEYLDVELGDGHHNADADAFATSQVMQKIIDRAIENGWSTDVLDKEKRDSKLKSDNDKFNADVAKFESDKKSFVAAQKEEGSTRLSSGARLSEAFEEPVEVTQQESIEAGSSIEALAGKKVAERIIQKLEETIGTTLTDQQKRTIENNVPGLVKEIAGRTLLNVEIDDAFSETGKQLLESISIDISSDGIPFISADPIPQLAEQIPDKRDWRTIELPRRDDIIAILEEAMKDTVVFSISLDEGIRWRDTDGNVIARRGDRDGVPYLEYESEEAKTRFPMLEMIAPRGIVIRNSSIGLPSLQQDTLPAPYLEAWQKHGQFLRELSRRAGELMGDEELFVVGSRINSSTGTYLRGYIGGITDPSKFNMGLDGKALQASHDLFGHLGTGRAFDRHGEWANDLAMMSIVDHPDSPLTPQEKLAVKHLIYMMYSSNRMLKVGRLDEQKENEKESETSRNQPRYVFDIHDLEPTATTEIRVYAGDFDSVIKKFAAVSSSKKLSSGRKSIYEADAKDVELALAHDVLGKNDRLSSGRVRESIPMNVPSKREQGDFSATRYGTQGSSGKIIRRDSSTWLSGLSSDEISRVIIPTNAEEYFEMWADDIAGPAWRTDKNRENFIKKYYAELQKDPSNIPVDYSPESTSATQKLIKDLLDSSPSVMWVMQNFGAPLIVPYTREGMNAYENRPDMKEHLELLAKQRGTEKIPFVSGLANRSLGSIGISPRALIDRESLLNDDKGVYPISMDPDRVPAPRDAHIDRSLEGTIVHEFGHWIQHRALWDTETNGASGKMRSYFGTGKLSDARYAASLDIAEEYGDYDTDDKRIEIYSQFIDLTERSPEEMFRAHPDEPLLSTSYGNINKREAIAEAFVAIMHPNKEMPEKTLSKKLRKDIYTLIGVDEKQLPWSDSETGSENRLSSGAKKQKRKNIFSRFRKEETEEEIVEEKREPPVVERPDGLVSFAPGPSEELLKDSSAPDEQTLKDEVIKDVQALALEFDGFQESELFGSGTRASQVAKKTVTSNLSRSVDFDVEDFINLFAADERDFGFHSTETFKAVQKMYETLKNLPADAASEQKRAAARGAFDTKSGRIIAAKIHDDILGRARYYDEILDKLETKEFEEIFNFTPLSFQKLTALDGSDESLFTPYLTTKLGTDDIRREFMEVIIPRRNVLENLIIEIKENEGKAFGLARTGGINPKTGEQDYELISLLGRAVGSETVDAILSLEISGGGIRLGPELAEIMSGFNGLLDAKKLIQIRESGLIKIDSSNIDSPEIQEAIKEHLFRNVRSKAGNYESKLESYSQDTGVVFFDLETTEGKEIVRKALVSDLIHTWAISANNANPVALAIQHEARKMFGLNEAVGWSTSPLKALRLEEKEGMPAHEFDGAPELTDAQAAIIRPILQKIYDSTQLYYKTKGITHIPAYRGFTQSDTRLLPGELESMETTMRPLSSWATNMEVARQFSKGYTTGKSIPTLIKAFVPIEDVFSNALTGFGCLNEDEVVLLGKPIRAIAIRTDDTLIENMDADLGDILIFPEGPEVLEKLKKITFTNIDETFENISNRKKFIAKTKRDALKNAEKIEELFSSGSDIQKIDLRETELIGKRLSGANLSGANMYLSNMKEINLNDANLTGAYLRRANLTSANLTGAKLTNANLVDANLTNANLSGARLRFTKLEGANLEGANLTGANLTNANLTNANLFDANLTNADLTDDANLTNANLVDANLTNADLTGADLTEANLEGANLEGANLEGANLTQSNLRDANLTGANLSGANLEGANLSGADLTGANLTNANLRGIDLNGIDLTKANLTDTIFSNDLTTGALFPEGYSVQKLSSGKKSHTPEWKTVEEIVDFEVLGASPDDSEEDRDDMVKESVGGDWMQWDPCREIRTAAYELAGIDEYSERDPNISQSGGFFGNSKFETAVSPEKRTEQARYLMASIVDSLAYKGRYEKQPYLYRAMMFSSPEEEKQFFDAMQVGSQVDIPLLAFVEIGPSPRGDHFLTRFGSDVLLVLEDFPGSYQTGGTFEPVFSNRHESDTLYNINEFAEAILADIENGEVDEENADYDKEFADKLIKLVEDYREAKTPLEKSDIKIDIEEALDEVGNETIKREWQGELLPEDHEEYYLAMDDEETGMTPREYVSGGRLEVVSVKPDESKTYRQIITLRQVGAFDPQEKGALVLKTDGENSTRLSSGNRGAKKSINWDSLYGEGLNGYIPDVREELEGYLTSDAIDSIEKWTLNSVWPKDYLDTITNEDYMDHYDVLQSRLIEAGFPEIVEIRRRGTPDSRGSIRNGSAIEGWKGGSDDNLNSYGIDNTVFVSQVPRENIIGVGSLEEGEFFYRNDGVETVKEDTTKRRSGKNTPKKAKPKGIRLHDDKFEKKFNQEVPDGDGNCFSEAVQQARKLAEAYDKVKIVHGYPLGTGGEAKGLRFPHAWAEFERDGEVWVRDYSNGNRIEYPQIIYYGIGNIEEDDVSRYDIKEAEANMIENEHYGPW